MFPKFDDDPLSGRRALVTGGSAGIGRETADLLGALGANVAVSARSESRLSEVAETIRSEHGVETLPVRADVREEDDVVRTVDTVVDEFGGLDILVNNAGTVVDLDTPTSELGTDSYRTMMETNVDGTFFATREALPHLRRAGGHLVFLGSFVGRHPSGSSPVYAASKWWVVGFAHSVETQYGADGVGVTVVNPSEVRTEIGSLDGAPYEERFDPGEVTEPETVAEVIAFAVCTGGSTLSEVNIVRRDKLSDTYDYTTRTE